MAKIPTFEITETKTINFSKDGDIELDLNGDRVTKIKLSVLPHMKDENGVAVLTIQRLREYGNTQNA